MEFRENPNIKLEQLNKLAIAEKGFGHVLSTTPLYTKGKYHIRLMVSNPQSSIALKSTAAGKNFLPRSNCVRWNFHGIYHDGNKIFDESINGGLVGISVSLVF